MREHNFDGLVGPTHSYAGLASGNLASMSHGGQTSSPKAAALQGLNKMRYVRDLGIPQAVLPPHPRPAVHILRQFGFGGSDEEVISRAAREAEHLLQISSSASSMWAANSATVFSSADSGDGKVHVVPANLQAMFHRMIEAKTTTRVLRSIFADSKHFVVHDPVPGGIHFSDEGAANHSRLFVKDKPALNLLSWGRSTFVPTPGPLYFPARQTLEASQAIARLAGLSPDHTLFPQQHPEGIDRGGFHTDVLAVGNGNFFMLHEMAFANWPQVERALRDRLGDELVIVTATNEELPVETAVRAYPFNSQILCLDDDNMRIIAPTEARDDDASRAFLERVVESGGPVKGVAYLDVRQSMDNGGGPACLRLRVPLAKEENQALGARVLLDDDLLADLETWIGKHFREHLQPADLADPKLWRESYTALDELTQILQLGSVYDFQLEKTD